MNIADLLDDKIKGILSEDSLTKIQKAFDKKVDLVTEAALIQQDEQYADRLKKFATVLNEDFTKKLQRVYNVVDKDRAQKLLKLHNKYQRVLHEQTGQGQAEIVNAVDSYFDEFLEEKFSSADMAQAVNNKSAYNVLSNLRRVLSINSATMQESVQEAVIDGKEKMTALNEQNDSLASEIKLLKESNANLQRTSLVEVGIAEMSEKKKVFVRKTFQDKDATFIKENFDYISRLYDRKERETVKHITEDAKKNRKVKPDVLIQEKVKPSVVNKLEDAVGDAYLPHLK